MRLTERDLEIIRYVGAFGCMTSGQVAILFGMNIKVCQRLLRRLCRADYLRNLPMPTVKAGRCPNLFYLGSQGAFLLDAEVSKPRLTLKLSHQRRNTDLMISIIREFSDSGLKCEVLPESVFRSINPSAELIHDGVFALRRNGKSALFMLENCSGTESVKSPSFHEDIEVKMERYVELFEKPNIYLYENYFEQNFNRFRLLFITNNEQRKSLIGRLAMEHDKHGFIWITTLRDFQRHGVNAPIWAVPALDQYNRSILER